MLLAIFENKMESTSHEKRSSEEELDENPKPKIAKREIGQDELETALIFEEDNRDIENSEATAVFDQRVFQYIKHGTNEIDMYTFNIVVKINIFNLRNHFILFILFYFNVIRFKRRNKSEGPTVCR